jgi:hypothetical protein
MPVDKRKVTIKTLLMAVGIPLLVFGIQMFISGQPLQGGVAVAFGVAATGVFVAFQEYDVPYEEDIRALIKSTDITTEDVKGLSEEVTRQIEEMTDTTNADSK